MVSTQRDNTWNQSNFNHMPDHKFKLHQRTPLYSVDRHGIEDSRQPQYHDNFTSYYDEDLPGEQHEQGQQQQKLLQPQPQPRQPNPKHYPTLSHQQGPRVLTLSQ